jgi:F-type H+-transporting ATPase subunit alpha
LARGQRLTEILKQDQFAPFTVEKQVLSLYMATTGGIDTVPVNEVRRFEKEFLEFVETNHAGILQDISEKKALDDAIRGNIKTALDAFKERFSAAMEAGAQPATA